MYYMYMYVYSYVGIVKILIFVAYTNNKNSYYFNF